MVTEQNADLTAEFIASSWLEEGLSSDQILFRSLGAFKRRSHRDVEMVAEHELGNFKGKVIESNRSGIYDYLPEQLFHLPSSNSINTLKKKVDEIRLQREKEQKSRLFFLPLEQEFFMKRVGLAQLEQRACELNLDSELLNELKAFWQAPDSISSQTFVKLLPVLPLISENRGNMEMAGEILSAVLNLTVRIDEVFGYKHFINSDATLAEARLGMDTIFGGELDTYMAALKVTIELPDEAALDECIHSTDFSTLLNWLLGWFIPVECDYSTELRLGPGASVLRLAEDRAVASRLGYSELAAD